MGTGGQRQALVALPPGKRPGTHCVWFCVDPRSVRMGAENLTPMEFDLRIVQPVESRYANYAILATPKCVCVIQWSEYSTVEYCTVLYDD